MYMDINCDMGESFGAYQLGQDEELLDAVTSANIACGFHAGDPSVMKRTVHLALEKGVAIGAHPGLPDLAGFGRRIMDVSPEEAYDLTLYQIGALQAFLQAEGASMQHVKPHGALYNMAAKDEGLAAAIAKAVRDIDPTLILYGLSGSLLIKAGEHLGLTVANEVFSDRTYQDDGTLTPRKLPHALITDQDQAVNQVIRMFRDHKVSTMQGNDLSIKAQTVCVHGDGAHALAFAQHLRKACQQAGIVPLRTEKFL